MSAAPAPSAWCTTRSITSLPASRIFSRGRPGWSTSPAWSTPKLRWTTCATPTAFWSMPSDRLDNLGQIRALLAGGYAGPFSFEPFSPNVHTLADPAAALADSMAFIRAGV